MDLPIFKKQSEPSAEHLWSLAIGKNWVDSAIWKVEQEKVHIVAHGGPFPYQEGDIKSLVEAADGSLSNAAAKIKVEIKEPSKVVFGLPPAYLENGEIKKEYRSGQKYLRRRRYRRGFSQDWGAEPIPHENPDL